MMFSIGSIKWHITPDHFPAQADHALILRGSSADAFTPVGSCLRVLTIITAIAGHSLFSCIGIYH